MRRLLLTALSLNWMLPFPIAYAAEPARCEAVTFTGFACSTPEFLDAAAHAQDKARFLRMYPLQCFDDGTCRGCIWEENYKAISLESVFPGFHAQHKDILAVGIQVDLVHLGTRDTALSIRRADARFRPCE